MATRTPTLGQTVIYVKSSKVSYSGIVVLEPTEAQEGVISIYTYPSIKSPVWKKKLHYMKDKSFTKNETVIHYEGTANQAEVTFISQFSFKGEVWYNIKLQNGGFMETKFITKKNKTMKSDFKLVGLSLPKSMTCEPLDNENIFWPNVGLTQDRFDALWNWVDKGGFWEAKWIAEIEHEGLNDNGTPVNPTVIEVKENNWTNAKQNLPTREGYYDVKYADGTEDSKPFRIRPRQDINGFMTENTVTHWRESTDLQDFEID